MKIKPIPRCWNCNETTQALQDALKKAAHGEIHICLTCTALNKYNTKTGQLEEVQRTDLEKLSQPQLANLIAVKRKVRKHIDFQILVNNE